MTGYGATLGVYAVSVGLMAGYALWLWFQGRADRRHRE